VPPRHYAIISQLGATATCSGVLNRYNDMHLFALHIRTDGINLCFVQRVVPAEILWPKTRRSNGSICRFLRPRAQDGLTTKAILLATSANIRPTAPAYGSLSLTCISMLSDWTRTKGCYRWRVVTMPLALPRPLCPSPNR
jgi:hypothetical protein